jgi:glycosyltransferase involved in cell wall biosynthesis
VRALASHQAESGHQVTVLTTDQGARHWELPVELADGVAVERLKVRGPDRLAYAPGFAAALRARLPQTDLVHIHSIFTYLVHASLREAGRVDVPVVLRPCGQLHRYSLQSSAWPKAAYLALWGRMVRATCTAWHFTSASEAAGSWPWDASRRFVVPNGIEASEFALNRAEARECVWRHLPLLERSRYVLFLGRLHPKKRLDLLLEAFLAGAPPEFKLVVAGPDEGNLWPTLQSRLLRAADAAKRVVRLGLVVGRKKVRLLAGASLFALPSEHENFGVAALEALAAGTCVLLSPNVDLGLAAAAANLGRLVPLFASAWRGQLRAALADEAWLSQGTERAPRWVQEHYAWGPITRELERQYRSLLTGRPMEPWAVRVG